MRLTFSYFSLPLFFLLFSTFHATSTNNLIPETCKKCVQKSPNLTFKFCVTSLQAASGSHRADDLRKLGKISIKLIKHNVTNTRHHIQKLLKNNRLDPFVRACLDDCFSLYSDAIPTLGQALKDYKTKHFENVNIDVSSVIDVSTTCEDGFKEKKGVISPLTKRNKDTFQLSALSLSIINMLN
ncbi:putative invertase inhibitor [Juglans microcarpa x Juglans regia]|uniref:putative invertase inhibitor n=1 Tax=Juglans microcarpa x Juglans regia TaxID=2249226 RepID=UPI001B7DCD72|nr:putative invertase inhibitor [Juglans microcarpa x Juglans regia]